MPAFPEAPPALRLGELPGPCSALAESYSGPVVFKRARQDGAFDKPFPMFHHLMIECLTSLPVIVNVVVFVGASVVLTLLFLGFVHRRYSPADLKRNNEVAGLKFGLLGAVYGLLVALALVAVWESYTRAEENAATEQSCIRSLRREARGLSKERRSSIAPFGYTKSPPTVSGARPPSTRGPCESSTR